MELTAWLAQLDDAGLDLLDRMLRSGRVGPGSGEALLRSYDLPLEWAGGLAALERAGWTRGLLVEAVRAVVEARRQDGQDLA